MILRIIIEDDEGGAITERQRKADDAFDLDLLDWNENKAEMIAEIMNPEPSE